MRLQFFQLPPLIRFDLSLHYDLKLDNQIADDLADALFGIHFSLSRLLVVRLAVS